MRPLIAVRAARIRPQRIKAQVHRRPVEPSGRIFVRAFRITPLTSMLMKHVESIRGQFFSLAGISHQPQQGFHQPRIVLQKGLFENVVGGQFRPVAQKQCFVTLPHTN